MSKWAHLECLLADSTGQAESRLVACYERCCEVVGLRLAEEPLHDESACTHMCMHPCSKGAHSFGTVLQCTCMRALVSFHPTSYRVVPQGQASEEQLK